MPFGGGRRFCCGWAMGMAGGSGDDLLKGGSGNGDPGFDVGPMVRALYGGPGDDAFYGGGGNDLLVGGSGATCSGAGPATTASARGQLTEVPMSSSWSVSIHPTLPSSMSTTAITW